ncbi:hypothetical protein ACQ1XD_004738 [Pseudomonas aeruginosa]|uniref:hypothetical protein n=1 Tax=Pseudomonas aeruginosa TaxID=287 RepID=UPI00071C1116|nr:hypothetical protein [Pseudomonas aeruginosa]EKB9387769.1 hypothetical protein [Pseudomonas aeruginosa]EKD1543920.1 hypothetical protein [Pseudomonas aeruginosa]EKU4830312.1 hypothetical protein [Pseudomonas aeruginosa]EKV4553689.1 hypothetical protein [Pseudomonas aeruginosa]EKV8096580.1 hypothetical protein [Pseudomonas aeruginosa]
MIGSVHFVVEGQIVPSYVLDIAGNLIRRTATGSPHSLIPFAVELVTPAAEVNAPRPWSITAETVMTRVAKIASLMPDVITAYPGEAIQLMTMPFAARVETNETDESIMQAIDMLPGLDDEPAKAVRETLAIHGIHPIPVRGSYNEHLHQARAGEICVGEVVKVADGWFSNMKVYRKALVRPA